MWQYPDSILRQTLTDGSQDSTPDSLVQPTSSDQYDIDVQRRNFLMYTMPHMARLAYRRQRHFVGRALRPMRPFLTPNIYGATLVAGNLLSPFHYSNRR